MCLKIQTLLIDSPLLEFFLSLTVKVGEKREHKDALGSLGLGRSGLPPLDFPPGLGGGLGPMLTPSLEVLQSLYGAQPGEPRDVLASVSVCVCVCLFWHSCVHACTCTCVLELRKV